MTFAVTLGTVLILVAIKLLLLAVMINQKAYPELAGAAFIGAVGFTLVAVGILVGAVVPPRAASQSLASLCAIGFALGGTLLWRGADADNPAPARRLASACLCAALTFTALWATLFLRS